MSANRYKHLYFSGWCTFLSYISGTVGIVDTEGNSLDNDRDMGDQTANALARVGEILDAHGASRLSILTSVSVLLSYLYMLIKTISLNSVLC